MRLWCSRLVKGFRNNVSFFTYFPCLQKKALWLLRLGKPHIVSCKHIYIERNCLTFCGKFKRNVSHIVWIMFLFSSCTKLPTFFSLQIFFYILSSLLSISELIVAMKTLTTDFLGSLSFRIVSVSLFHGWSLLKNLFIYLKQPFHRGLSCRRWSPLLKKLPDAAPLIWSRPWN